MRLTILRVLIPVFLLVTWGVAAGVQSSGSSSGSSQNPNDSSGQQQPQQPDQSKDKKSKNHKRSQDVSEVFSTAVADNLLNDLRSGLDAHNRRLMLSAFDADKMDSYLEFENQIEAFFNRYEAFTVYFRIVQTSTDGPKGLALVDIQLEEIPRAATSPPIRKNGQVRFELERGKKGWKIVDFNPRNFFS